MASKEETPVRQTPSSAEWRSRVGQHRTPSSASRANFRRKRYIDSLITKDSMGYSTTDTATTSTSLAHDALLTNLNSALKALGGTPLNARSRNRFITEEEEDISSRLTSPVQPMQSLDDELQCTPSPAQLSSADKMMKIQEKHSKLVQECASLETRILDAESKRESLHKKLMQADSDLQKLRAEKSSVGDGLKALLEEYDTRQKDLRCVEDEYNCRENELMEIERRIQSATESMHQIQNSKSEYEDALENLKEIVTCKEKEIKTLDEIIIEKTSTSRDMEKRCCELQKEILDATAKKDELNRLVLKAQHDLYESEETMKRLECLSSEGFSLVEEHSRRATLAQEKWEEAEERLAQIESELVEASARLEAKKAMIRDVEQQMSPKLQIGSPLCEEQEGIKGQVMLLRQLQETTARKLEERKQLAREIEQLKLQKRKLDIQTNNENTEDTMSSYCKALERALEEAVAEIDRRSEGAEDSIQICEVLRTKLGETENRLAYALTEIDQSNRMTSCTGRNVKLVDPSTRITNKHVPRVQEFAEESINDQHVFENISSTEENQQNHFSDFKSRVDRKEHIVARLRREKDNAIQRIHGLQGLGNQIRSLRNTSIQSFTQRRGPI